MRSTPSGAEVRVGDRSTGRTPVERPLWVGRHELTIGSRPVGRVTQSVDIKEGLRAEIDLQLKAPDPDCKQAEQGTR